MLVPAMIEAGINMSILETLPEAIASRLRRFILESRTNPPTTWSKELLDLAGRQDLSMLMCSNQGKDGENVGQVWITLVCEVVYVLY